MAVRAGLASVGFSRPGTPFWVTDDVEVVTIAGLGTASRLSILLGGGKMPLTHDQMQRYQRQIAIPDFGIQGQERLLASKVLVVGVGGLGSAAAYYLAAAGVGHLGLVDSEVVELSNLQRQIIHSTSRLGQAKVESARQRLHDLNPDVRITTYMTRLTPENLSDLVIGYNVVVDCVDNLDTRYVVNDSCVRAGIPLVEAGVMGYEGMVTTIRPKEGPCYRCIFPRQGTGASTGRTTPVPVVGALVGMVGCIEALEAIKLLLGTGRSLKGRLLIIDGSTMEFREIKVGRNPHCTVCGDLE